jgi:hypothetical protein
LAQQVGGSGLYRCFAFGQGCLHRRAGRVGDFGVHAQDVDGLAAAGTGFEGVDDSGQASVEYGGRVGGIVQRAGGDQTRELCLRVPTCGERAV